MEQNSIAHGAGRWDVKSVAADLGALLGFSAALAVTAGVIKTPIGVPGHSAVFWIPVLVLAGAHRRRGMAVGAALLGGTMAGAWCGIGMTKLAGLLAAGAVVEAFGLGRVSGLAGWWIILVAMLAHVAKLGTKVLPVLLAGMPLNRAGLPPLLTLAQYLAFGVIGGAISWGMLSGWARLRRDVSNGDKGNGPP